MTLGYYLTRHLEPIVFCASHPSRGMTGREPEYAVLTGWNLASGESISWSETTARSERLVPLPEPLIPAARERAAGIVAVRRDRMREVEALGAYLGAEGSAKCER